jgi:hypothetical protein
MWNPFSGVSKGFRAIRSDFKRGRLIREHARVEGSGYFHKNPDKASDSATLRTGNL